jgi:hypothetical protein
MGEVREWPDEPTVPQAAQQVAASAEAARSSTK